MKYYKIKWGTLGIVSHMVLIAAAIELMKNKYRKLKNKNITRK